MQFITYKPFINNYISTSEELPKLNYNNLYNYSSNNNLFDDDDELPTLNQSIYSPYQKVEIKQEVKPQSNNVQFNSSKADIVINNARKLIKTPYKFGGTNPNTGLDCSGFIQAVFSNSGVNVPRTSLQQEQFGTPVKLENIQKGDVVSFNSPRSPSKRHVALVSKIQDGQIYVIDSGNKKTGVSERKIPKLEIRHIRRYV